MSNNRAEFFCYHWRTGFTRCSVAEEKQLAAGLEVEITYYDGPDGPYKKSVSVNDFTYHNFPLVESRGGRGYVHRL